jgi:hypothetical protein
MITYDPKTKTIKMDLVDLEHCGFDHTEYQSELFMAGLLEINKPNPALEWPETMIINFSGGAVKIASGVCSRCLGRGYFMIGSDECKCPDCDGTGKKC